MPSALAKNKHQAVWWKPYRFAFRRCSSFSDRIAWWESIHTGGAIRCTDSSRKNAMWQPCRLRWEKINVKRYGWKLYRFVFRGCSSFPDRIAWWKSFTLCTTNRVEKIMHCVGKKEIMDRCFPCRSCFIIRKTCLQGRFQPVSIRGNKISDMEKKPYRLFLCCYIYREVLLANGAVG